MDIEKLDMLLDELRLPDSNAKSVDFNEFCINKLGQNWTSVFFRYIRHYIG